MTHGWTKNEEKLLEAARKCDGGTISEIVETGKVNVDVTNKSGCTALHLCCKSADLESIAVLLEHGAKSEVFDQAGMAPFHYAADKDYIETMAMLVSYGADVDVTNTKSHMTPLHYASANKRTRAMNFLLFCGADPCFKDKDGHEAVKDMSNVQTDLQKVLRIAVRERKIQICGKMMRPNEKHHFKSGLKLENMDKDSKAFSFLYRMMPIEYMGIDQTAGGNLTKVFTTGSFEIISDVYDYLVNQTVHSVKLSVPVYTKASTFESVFMRDNSGEDFKCIECVENSSGIFYTFSVTLKAKEDNFNAFSVVSVTRKDRFLTTGKAQTIKSSMDERFGVNLPDRCLPPKSTIELQMLPVYNYLDGMNTEYVTSVSNFCSIRLQHKNKRTINVTLPLPESTQEVEQSTDHTVYYTNEDTNTSAEWKEITGCHQVDDKSIQVNDPAVGNGTCIVLMVQKEKKNDFVDHVSEFLKWLYSSAFNRLKPCCFYGMTCMSSPDTYKVHIGVADSKRVDKVIQKWNKVKFVSQMSQITASHLIKSNSHFAVKPGIETILKGEACQTLVYQCNREFHQEFIICGKEHDVVPFQVHKIFKETYFIRSYATNAGTFISQLNIELLQRSNTEIEHQSSYVFKEYPDNKFLNWLSGELGNEWMMVGSCLGLKYSLMEGIEKDIPLKRAIQTMLFSWREGVDKERDLGLTVLIHSLTRVGRKDLVMDINMQVQRICQEKPNGHLSTWVAGLTSGLDDVDSGPSEDTTDSELCISCLIEEPKSISPFKEAFLHSIVSIIGLNLNLLAQLNLPQSTTDSVRHAMRDPTSAMFKCLLIARRGYGDIIKFFRELMLGLEAEGNNEAISRIKQECKDWFNSKRSLDKEDKRLEAVLDRY